MFDNAPYILVDYDSYLGLLWSFRSFIFLFLLHAPVSSIKFIIRFHIFSCCFSGNKNIIQPFFFHKMTPSFLYHARIQFHYNYYIFMHSSLNAVSLNFFYSKTKLTPSLFRLAKFVIFPLDAMKTKCFLVMKTDELNRNFLPFQLRLISVTYLMFIRIPTASAKLSK